MAEFVEKRCELGIRELERMKESKIMDEEEIRSIANKRRKFEYKIQRRTKCKEDYLKYIQYQMDLLKLIKQRSEKLNLKAASLKIEYSLKKKISVLYEQVTMRFKEDIDLWLSYMHFCKRMNFHINMSTMIGRMLQTHLDQPRLWCIAAHWEVEQRKNFTNAREFLLAGLRFHPKSELLFADLLQLELYAAANCGTDHEIEVPLAMKRAVLIYRKAIKRIKDVTFLIRLLHVVKFNKHAEEIESDIIRTMVNEHTDEPEMWNAIAREHMEGLTCAINEDNSVTNIKRLRNVAFKQRLNDCNEIYLTAIRRIPTKAMWSFYLGFLVEINRRNTPLPNFTKKLLKTALLLAHQNKQLEEKHYLDWIRMEEAKTDESSFQKLYKILNEATDLLPASIDLWCKKVEYLGKMGQDEEAKSELEKAIKCLGPEALPLWKIKLLYVNEKTPENVEQVFEAAIQEAPAISETMKSDYIEWLASKKGIESARKIYSSLSILPPFCLDLHKTMAALELDESEVSKENARRPHELSILQFGKTSVEVWISYILFEMKHGDLMRVTDLHRRAVKTLNAVQSDEFITEYSLIKANCE